LLTTALLTATTLLPATTLLATTPALFLAFPLLTLAFLSFAISLLLPTLLSGSRRLARFVRILLCFHSTFHCYITDF
jgi:hypothetical protein